MTPLYPEVTVYSSWFVFFKAPQVTIEPCLGDNQEQRQSAQES